MSSEKNKLPIISNHSLFPELMWMSNSRISARFKGKQDKVTFTRRNVSQLIVFELGRCSQDFITDFTRKDCLFKVLIQINILI